LDIANTFRNIVRTLRYSKKADWQMYSLYLKLVLLGVAVVGGIAFVIHLISTVVFTPLAAHEIKALFELVD
jgi:preprotein translocase subunit Sss1